MKKKIIFLLSALLLVPTFNVYAEKEQPQIIKEIVGEKAQEDKDRHLIESEKAIVYFDNENRIEKVEYKEIPDYKEDKVQEYLLDKKLISEKTRTERKDDLTDIFYLDYGSLFDPYNYTEVKYEKDEEIKDSKKYLSNISIYRQKTIVNKDIVADLEKKNINEEEIIKNAAFKQNIDLGYYTVDETTRSIDLVQQMMDKAFEDKDSYTTIVFTLKGKNKENRPITISYDYINDKIFRVTGIETKKEETKEIKEVKPKVKKEKKKDNLFSSIFKTIKNGFYFLRNLLPF